MSTKPKERWYRKWASMLARCYNPSHPAFPHYAAKGIEVCDRWRGKDGSKNFLADMGIPPDGLTLERINNSLGYSPDNCRWATWKEQAQNRSPKSHHQGSLRHKAILAGLPYMVVYLRIRNGWSEADALRMPKGSKNPAG